MSFTFARSFKEFAYSLLDIVLISYFSLLILYNLFKYYKENKKKIEIQKPDSKFENIIGIDDYKEEIESVVEFLKHPKKFIKMGGNIPKGVLLVGPPGVGKTELARAIASESGVIFTRLILFLFLQANSFSLLLVLEQEL